MRASNTSASVVPPFTVANPEVRISAEALELLAQFIADLAIRRARAELERTTEPRTTS